MSKLDRQEVDNALNQAAKEIGTRFDFRGVGASIAWSGEHAVDIRANSEERAKAVLDVFKDKLVKRGVSLKTLDPDDPWAAQVRQLSDKIDDQMLQSKTLDDPLKEQFDKYRNSFRFRFLAIDNTLKMDCSSLRKIDGPLTEILKELVP